MITNFCEKATIFTKKRKEDKYFVVLHNFVLLFLLLFAMSNPQQQEGSYIESKSENVCNI